MPPGLGPLVALVAVGMTGGGAVLEFLLAVLLLEAVVTAWVFASHVHTLAEDVVVEPPEPAFVVEPMTLMPWVTLGYTPIAPIPVGSRVGVLVEAIAWV